MTKGRWLSLAAVLAAVAVLFGVRAWAVNQNPLPGSVWTWLGPTFGADWVALPSTSSALTYGALCDGVTDDAPPINRGTADIAAGGGGTLFLPPGKTCAVGSTILVPNRVKITGAGHSSSVIAAKVANMEVVRITGNKAGFEGLQINCSVPGGTNSSGNCVSVSGPSEIMIRDFSLYNPYTGISMGASVLVNIEDGYIYGPTPGTGRCLLVKGGNNQVLTNVFCGGRGAAPAEQPQFGLEIQDTQGIWLNNVQVLYGGSAFYVNPGDGQRVTWVFDTQSAYDTSSGNGIAIVPTGTGTVLGYYCMGCWTSTMGLSGVVVEGSGSTETINDIHFIGHRSFGNQHAGISIDGGSNIVVQNSSVCGNSAAGDGLYDGISVGVSAKVMIQGNTIGDCAGFPGGRQHLGINTTGGTHLSILGNRLSGNQASGFVGIPSTDIAVIKDNLGYDDQLAAIPTATTIALPNTPIISMSGTTNVQNMTGGWQGRQIVIIPETGGWSFVPGGTPGASMITTTPTVTNVPILATFIGMTWFLK